MTRRLGLWQIVFVAALALSTAASSDTNSKETKDNSQAQKSYERPTDPSLYVGSDTCKTCHEDIFKNFETTHTGKQPSPRKVRNGKAVRRVTAQARNTLREAETKARSSPSKTNPRNRSANAASVVMNMER